MRTFLFALIGVIGLIASSKVQAASGTWTNTPTDSTWTNVLNWNGGIVAGTVNNTGNNGTDGSSIANFTNAITGTIGTAANPIIPDDGTIVNGKARMMSQLNFNGPTCGAYVFSTLSAYQNRSATQPETGVMSLCIPSSTITVNGSFIGTSVVNPQTFLLPVQIRLPSSTTGQYGFTNNATSPLATYFFNQMWLYPDATGRGVTFVFAGSNTGTNTVASLSQSAFQTGSPSGIRKEGTGRWIFSGTNIFNTGSAMNINDGTLEVQHPGAFGSATTATVNSNAVLQVDGVDLVTSTLTVQRSGTIRANGSITVNGITVGTAAAGTSPNLVTTSASDVMTNGTAANKVTGGAADSTIHVAGPGTVLLGFDNNYIGKWSVDAGSLVVMTASGLGTGANINVAAGGILNLSNLGATTWNPTTTGIGGSGTGTTIGSTAGTILADPAAIIDLATGSKAVNLTFTPTAFSGDTTHPALYVSQGTLSMGGNAFTINNASGTALGNGTYKLIQQASGSITSAGGYSVVGVTGSGVVPGSVASIQVTGGEVDLVVVTYFSKDLVWSGTGSTWDIGTTADWLNGASASVFNNSDNVTFNSVGSANPAVSLAGTLSPGNVVVSNVAAYTFTGAGSIAGGASLTKAGTGTLTLSTVNTYGGGTVISNGVLQVGVANAVPGIGAGNVSVLSPGILDLNANSDAINGLDGNGTVDTLAGGSPVLTVGNNDASGTFGGVLQNTAGALGLTKVGTGTETLTSANTYTGPTVINAGTLAVQNYNALGSGGSAVTMNLGTLDLKSSVVVGTFTGNGGTIANNSTATINQLVVTNSSTFNSVIADGSGGGGVSVLVAGGTFRMNGASTYSGGSIVAANATLAVGQFPGQAGTGGIIASNGATVASASTGGTASVVNNNITTVSGATVQFTGGGAGADSFNGLFDGDATTTNVFHGQLTFGGGVPIFSNFLGTAVFVPSGNGIGSRINSGTSFVNGGDNTTFEFQGGFLFNRNATTFSIGALTGGAGSVGQDGGGIANAGAPFATYLIGAKSVDSVFSGSISGSNNIVKVGSATLTLNGSTGFEVTSPDGGLTYETNAVLVNTKITYVGSTTISNGVLKIVTPVILTNSSSITLASATAVLDASQMGYIATDNTTFTNLATNGVFEVISGQTLAGIGTIRAANVLLDAGSTFNVGLPYGSLTATNTVELAGLVNMNVSVTNAPNASELLAQSFIVDGTASLVVSNRGPENYGVFQLFNHPISIPTVLPTLTGTNLWVNNLAVDGSITLVAPALVTVNTNPTNITATVSGGNLTLEWPADHTGWRLQTQTNSLAVGLATNWVDVAGAAQTNQVVVPINAVNGSVFFRMVYP